MKTDEIRKVLSDVGPSVVACSGGVDSMLLAFLIHRLFPQTSLIAHAVSPAVPVEAARRFDFYSRREGWRVERVKTGEFEDERYLSNPLNRCYFCKTHLYAVLREYHYEPGTGRYGRITDEKFRGEVPDAKPYPVLSGANLDDLREYRPGLDAAREAGVRHPFIEAEMTKEDIRELCRAMALPFADVAASPCLSSRIYTGNRVQPGDLELIDSLEMRLREITGAKTLRCRFRDRSLWIETTAEEREKFTDGILDHFRREVVAGHPGILDLALDPLPYRSGRAFVGKP